MVFRALTRILKTGVPEPSLPKSGSHTKVGVPAQKMGVLDCKSAVSESSGIEKIQDPKSKIWHNNKV